MDEFEVRAKISLVVVLNHDQPAISATEIKQKVRELDPAYIQDCIQNGPIELESFRLDQKDHEGES